MYIIYVTARLDSARATGLTHTSSWIFTATGHSYVQQFCISVGNAVYSPFLLQDIACQSAHYLARSNNPAQVTAQLRSPTLNSLVQKCLQM